MERHSGPPQHNRQAQGRFRCVEAVVLQSVGQGKNVVGGTFVRIVDYITCLEYACAVAKVFVEGEQGVRIDPTIRIQHHNRVMSGSQDLGQGPLQRKTLAASRFVTTYQASGTAALGHLRSAVRTIVGNDVHGILLARIVQCRTGVQRPLDGCFFIICRNNNGKRMGRQAGAATTSAPAEGRDDHKAEMVQTHKRRHPNRGGTQN